MNKMTFILQCNEMKCKEMKCNTKVHDANWYDLFQFICTVDKS